MLFKQQCGVTHFGSLPSGREPLPFSGLRSPVRQHVCWTLPDLRTTEPPDCPGQSPGETDLGLCPAAAGFDPVSGSSGVSLSRKELVAGQGVRGAALPAPLLPSSLHSCHRLGLHHCSAALSKCASGEDTGTGVRKSISKGALCAWAAALGACYRGPGFECDAGPGLTGRGLLLCLCWCWVEGSTTGCVLFEGMVEHCFLKK